ncbi:hypothetical protein [Rhodopirellula bahusiensis]|uniref:Uncharacterized protein n=1 Tax=Rhodopirellula bahusiensis TaxID=2014065 RepID=A0A2G1W6U7_9BACT|nr:hypothetical protein [Rhodopirellula bahusiensis]PHQ34731.1 hypothetical protein CEE69_12655 [Rhodopirellula bahusiensis]
MSKSPEQLRAMALSGTVSIPPRFPDLAIISFETCDNSTSPFVVVAYQKLSPKLSIKRTFFPSDLKCFFVPESTSHVDLENGEWFEGNQLLKKAQLMLDSTKVEGILYVREQAQSLLEMEAGMTAAESAEFYPPLPDDRSVNHYNMNPSGVSAGCD